MAQNIDLTFYNKTERPWLNRLDRSSLVGHTTSTAAKVWVRLKTAGDYQCALARVPLEGALLDPPRQAAGRWMATDFRTGEEIPLIAVVAFSVDGGSDFTSVIDTASHSEVPDLEPDTQYYFAIYSIAEARWELGRENHHGFRTMPVDGPGPWDVSFGLYSCHMPYDPNYPSKADASMWSIMADELRFSGARFVIGGGDQVYVDGTKYLDIWAWLKKHKALDPTLADMKSWYRDIYRGYWGFPSVMAVHRQFPNYMIWDDHEIMDGWGSFTKKELSNELDGFFEWEDTETNLALARRMFEAAASVYGEYQHAHNPTTPKGQYDYPVSQCGADFYFLDMRGQRDFNRKTLAILGQKQHQRFAVWLDQLDDGKQAPIFIVSTVPLVHLKDFVRDLVDWVAIFGARDDVRDHWAHDAHHAEFMKIMTAIFEVSERTGRPVVVLSGDVHLGSIFELFGSKNRYPKARVYQVTSSAITYAPLGPLKLALLSKGVARTGEIGVRKTASDAQTSSGFRFRNHLIFPQHNFALIRYRTDATATTSIQVDMIGQSLDGRVKESVRMELLSLPAS